MQFLKWLFFPGFISSIAFAGWGDAVVQAKQVCFQNNAPYEISILFNGVEHDLPSGRITTVRIPKPEEYYELSFNKQFATVQFSKSNIATKLGSYDVSLALFRELQTLKEFVR